MAKEIGAEYAEVQFADVSSPLIGQTSVEIKKVFDKLDKIARRGRNVYLGRRSKSVFAQGGFSRD